MRLFDSHDHWSVISVWVSVGITEVDGVLIDEQIPELEKVSDPRIFISGNKWKWENIFGKIEWKWLKKRGKEKKIRKKKKQKEGK